MSFAILNILTESKLMRKLNKVFFGCWGFFVCVCGGVCGVFLFEFFGGFF